MAKAFKFNHAIEDIPVAFGTDINLLEGETIQQIDGKPYLCWHDLIDIRVPLFVDASILLGKRVPLPLHGIAPRTVLNEIDPEWWDRTRKRVYSANGRYCCCCGVHQSKQKGWVQNQLDAHEVYDVNYETGESRLKCIVALCKFCHNGVHYGRLTAQRDSGKIQDKTFYSIISHANSILSQNNLPQKNWDVNVDDNINSIPWEQWRLTLTINGEDKSYYSLFKNKEGLEAHYA